MQITVEKAALKQSNSQYELQGEYVLPGSRDGKKERGRRGSDLGSVISSMGRWRMRLEVPHAEIAEMLPLARLVSRTTDPALQYRSKVNPNSSMNSNHILLLDIYLLLWSTN